VNFRKCDAPDVIEALEYYNAVKMGVQVNIEQIPIHLFEIMKIIEDESTKKFEQDIKKKK